MQRYCEWCEEPIAADRAKFGATSCCAECAHDIKLSGWRERTLRRWGEPETCAVRAGLAQLNPLAVAWGRGQMLAPVEVENNTQESDHV